jgi:hypothetical protein
MCIPQCWPLAPFWCFMWSPVGYAKQNIEDEVRAKVGLVSFG